MNPTHHLERSQHYLNFVPGNLAAGDCARAARALARSASHAVTAAAVHWHHRYHSRRRLTSAVGELVLDRRIAYSHLRTFRDVYRLLEGAVDATPDVACPDLVRKELRRLRRRVSRLNAAIASAMSADPDPLTLEQLIAQPELLPAPALPRPEMTMREYRSLQERSVDSAYANHPMTCPGCRDHRGPHDPPPGWPGNQISLSPG